MCRIAFVEFSEKEGLDKALKVDNPRLKGRALSVNAAVQGGGGHTGTDRTAFVKGFDRLQDENSVSLEPSKTASVNKLDVV